MNTSIGNIQSDVHVGDFQSDERHSLRNRDQVPQALRQGSIGKQWKKGRTLYFGVVLVFFLFAASNSLLSLQYVEGFYVPKIGGGPEQRHKQQCSTTTSTSASAKLRLNVVPLKLAGDEMSSEGNGLDTIDINSIKDETAANSNTNNLLLLNFNASGSIGSLLMQMQRKEAEMRLLNKSASLLFSEDQALKLDATNSSATVSSFNTNYDKDATEGTAATSLKSDLFSWIRKQDGDGIGSTTRNTADQRTIDDEIARDLDNSVSLRITNSVKDVTILEPPEINRIKSRTGMVGTTTSNKKEENNGINAEETMPDPKKEEKGQKGKMSSTSDIDVVEDNLPPFSRAEHYNGRIGRDMRHLAVSIASCIDSVEEWQLFCQQSTGGLEPIIDCIREGAESVREGSPSSPLSSGSDDRDLVSPTGNTRKSSLTRKEEDFQVATRACKVLRDLCALSLDLAAVITDGLLRANAAYKSKGEHTLMDDMCTILRQADDFADNHHQSSDKKIQRSKRRSFRRRTKEKVVQATSSQSRSSSKWPMGIFRGRREARLRCKLYVTQLLLAMTCASDSAVDAIRSTEGLKDVLLMHSSYARKEQRRRWMRYPGEKLKSMWLAKRKIKPKKSTQAFPTQKPNRKRRQPFIEAASLQNNLNGRILGTANQLLAAIGYNEWVPKMPGQKGLRILCLDGGGSRGMTSVVAMKCMVDSLGGMEVADCFDLVVGTSTGAIIAFLVGLNRETSEKAVERYDVLIRKIFTKSAFSTPMLLFTTATYDESIFMNVLTDILGDNSMLDSRANPAVPFVFAVTSKMSSNPTHIALFRNYNYNGGELPDPFVVDPDDARENLDLSLNDEGESIRLNTYPKKKGIVQPAPGTITPDNGSRHPGSFRALQKYALRASTAAPTVFKPVLMGGEMYCDGGIVASNPSAIAIHEARTIFPDVPIELVVSIGTGGFKEVKSEPRIGWDGIIGQIINSATDGEQIHHILEDVLGDGTTAQGKSSVSNTSYMRFNPTLGLPDEFPIDVTDPDKLQQIKTITREYMKEPEQQRKLEAISDILKGRSSNRFPRWFRR